MQFLIASYALSSRSLLVHFSEIFQRSTHNKCAASQSFFALWAEREKLIKEGFLNRWLRTYDVVDTWEEKWEGRSREKPKPAKVGCSTTPPNFITLFLTKLFWQHGHIVQVHSYLAITYLRHRGCLLALQALFQHDTSTTMFCIRFFSTDHRFIFAFCVPSTYKCSTGLLSL